MEEIKLKDLDKDIRYNNDKFECKLRNRLTCIFVIIGLAVLVYLAQFIPR